MSLNIGADDRVLEGVWRPRVRPMATEDGRKRRVKAEKRNRRDNEAKKRPKAEPYYSLRHLGRIG
jgi:hypothetical protein